MKPEGLLPTAQKNSFYSGILFYDTLKLKKFMIAYRLVNISWRIGELPSILRFLDTEDGGSKLLHDVCKNQPALRHIPEDLNFRKW